jgi:D-aspartate ligase
MSNGIAPAVILSHGGGGLGTVRSLARRNVPVTVIAYECDDPVLHSRCPALKIAVPGTTDDAKEAELLSILEELPEDRAVLMSTSDRLVTLMSDHRAELLQKYRFMLPPKELLDALNDKSKEVRLLDSLGFATPKTAAELPATPEILEQQLRFPIIFKPHSYAAQGLFPKKNEIVRDREELREFYSRWIDALHVLIAQEVITGPDTLSWVCSGTFNHENELLDCGIKQKLRSLPAHFGGSTYAVSRGNEEILRIARDIGKKLNYVGHAGLEFRWDQRDSRFCFIELNPRLPANVGFDEDCGLPTVWNSYRVSLGENPAASGIEQREGVYFIDLTGDFRSLAADRVSVPRMLASSLSLLTKRTSGLFFAWDDPLPGVVVGYRFFVRTLRKLFARLSASN